MEERKVNELQRVAGSDYRNTKEQAKKYKGLKVQSWRLCHTIRLS